MNIPRSCGIILHITSLPSPYGIGDLGPSAYRFADFLAAASVRYWQILPLNYTEEGSGFSPYSGLSAFAGNTFLISPELLLEEGLVDEQSVQLTKPFPASSVDYPSAVTYKRRLFDVAYQHFREDTRKELRQSFELFCTENAAWLEDYALYMALKKHFDDQCWSCWPKEVKSRQPTALKKMKASLGEEVDKQKFLQFLFFRQWNALRQYCTDKNITFIGDMPFYVGYDSSDVWANPSYFKLDHNEQPKVVAGVPPDYFSETGQLWGMPIFDWDALKAEGYSWWLDRIAQNMKMFGILRLDHFRAFANYWEVPASEKTAINGYWVEGPGNDFFTALKTRYPDLPFIAEDLGEIDRPVRDLMAKFKLPGMKVLQFAFFSDSAKSGYIPHYHIPDSIVYTGTHDNNTLAGWFANDLTRADKSRLRTYLGKALRKESIHDDLIRMALQSVAKLAVFPLQDLFGLGQEAIMNKPSTTKGNWAWRCPEALLTPQTANKLKSWLKAYDREALQEEPEKTKSKQVTKLKRQEAKVELEDTLADK